MALYYSTFPSRKQMGNFPCRDFARFMQHLKGFQLTVDTAMIIAVTGHRGADQRAKEWGGLGAWEQH